MLLTTLLALAAGAVVGGLLWAWARPSPSMPLHEVAIGSIVAAGTSLSAGLLAVIWLPAGSGPWLWGVVIPAALLISAAILLVWAVVQGRVYERDRQRLLA